MAESAEEAGINIGDVKFFKRSTLGSTIQWDLFVFEATNWSQREAGQSPERGEESIQVSWVSYDDIKAKILKGEMQEERVALILLQWLEAKGSQK